MSSSLLGGLPPDAFLRRHWQKRPLLVRQAVPGFRGIVDRAGMFDLATRPQATSRLVIQHPGRNPRWERQDGPFGAINARMLPKSHWTLLVHGVESLLPGGWQILRQFAFLPAARIDDLMISHAADSGSVGPHEDPYDVFLLQGSGRRRWQVSTSGDRRLDPDAAIKVLANFVPEDEWVLDPGDMLYLPPGVAHFGVAEGPCFTYSIGFLAPTHAELTQNFLEYLGAVLAADGDPDARYSDPDLRVTDDPVQIGDRMLAQVSSILSSVVERIRVRPALFAEFLGRFLTRPTTRAPFAAPARPLSVDHLTRRLRGRGHLTLALPTRGLMRRGRIFMNGDAATPPRAALPALRALLAARQLPLPLSPSASAAVARTVHGWYAAGYLHPTR